MCLCKGLRAVYRIWAEMSVLKRKAVITSTTSRLDMQLRTILLRMKSGRQSYLYLACGHASTNAWLFMVQISGAKGPNTLQVRGKVSV